MFCSSAHSVETVDQKSAVQLLRAGGLLIYPTETFYALGCLAANTRALDAICLCKDRPPEKPLPLIAALETVGRIAAIDRIAPCFFAFWPAPLTLLLPLLPNVSTAPCLCNQHREIALRVSPHPTAAALAKAVGQCLTASSANLRDKTPVTDTADLDAAFLERVCAQGLPVGLLPHAEGTKPLGGLPSTIIRPFCGEGFLPRCSVLRPGAFPQNELEKAGILCC